MAIYCNAKSARDNAGDKRQENHTKTTTYSRHRIQVAVGLFIAVFALALPAQAQDAYEDRLVVAERYVRVSDVPKMVNSMYFELAKTYPQNLQQEFMRLMDISFLETVMILAMAEHFTIEELELLEEFYGSPVGSRL